LRVIIDIVPLNLRAGSPAGHHPKKESTMNSDVSTPLRGLRVGAVLIAAGISLAACGSSSSGGTAAAGSSTAPSAAASTPAASSGGSTLDADAFCTYAKKTQSEETKQAQAFSSDSPKQLAAYVQQSLSELQAFAAAAPSAIKGDVTTVVAGVDKLFTALKNANYDYTKIPPSSVQAIDTPAFTQADAAISSYLKSKCGISESNG
jgi:hypothetical protein